MAQVKRATKPSEKALAAAAQVDAPPVEKRPRGRPKKERPPVPGQQTPQTEESESKAEAPVVPALAVNKKRAKSSDSAKPAAKKPRSEGNQGQAPAHAKGKARSRSQAPAGTRPPHIERMVAKFYEPTVDFFAETLTNGLADGSIMDLEESIGESRDGGSEEFDEELSDFDPSLPVTSTPFPPRKKAAAKKKKSKAFEDDFEPLETITLKVHVWDGVGMRQIDISSENSFSQLREAVANAMQRATVLVRMGYESPWSQKVGTKKIPIYITNEEEYDEFWRAIRGFLAKRTKSKQAVTLASLCIAFRNMLDEGQPATKQTGRSKNAQNAKPSKTDDVQEARDSAKQKVIESTDKVQVGMFCNGCNRPCYKTWNNLCRPYGNQYIAEHAKLLAAGIPGVVADKVPHTMSSKLLDFVRPGRKVSSRADADGEGDERPPQEAFVKAEVPPTRETEVRAHKGPLDYPLISKWLSMCEDDLERGRDRHEYAKLAPVFETNGCTRIDDITRMTTELIRELAAGSGVEVSIGLVHRVHEYALLDVSRVKSDGKLL